MELFKLLPPEKWFELLGPLRSGWPSYSAHYNWVINAIKIRKKSPSIIQDIYCSNTNSELRAFVGIQKFGCDVITLFATPGNEELLKTFLLKNDLINCTEEIYFPSVQKSFYSPLNSILKNKKIVYPNMTINSNIRLLYMKSREECYKTEIGKVPDQFELRPIQECDVALISSVWPQRNQTNPEKTEKHFIENLKINSAIGLFKTNDDTLVAWVFHGVLGNLHALQTLEKYRRQGFGKLVLNALTRKLAMEENLDSTVFIMKGNQASCNIFESLGFKFCGTAHFINIK